MTIVLASGSAIRRKMLQAAGLSFEVDLASVDEDAAKADLRAAGLAPREQANALAELKALSVSKQRAGLVIGADQVLALDNETLDKPKDLEEARSHLQRMRGRTHELLCAAVVATDGNIVWRCLQTPKLKMHDFSDAFIDAYIARAGDAVLASVGAYQLEGLGAQLFERVEGDYFSVLGLPLLPLLAFLREQEALEQ
ncbi:MAG: Maf family nucleotide pyrophosphatase [Terricaulis sp.]